MELTKKQINELAKQYAYVLKSEIKSIAKDYKTMRGLNARLARVNSDNEVAYTKPQPIYIVLDVEWKRNKVWGYNPTVTLKYEDAAGNWEVHRDCASASGYGYDKLSSAVAEALNQNCKQILWKARTKNFKHKNKPYGIRKSDGWLPHFEGGVGINCYYQIFNWLGYDMYHVANGKTYDKFVIVDKKHKARFYKNLRY